jgi:hypothetical protein
MAEGTDLYHRVQSHYGADSVRIVTDTAVFPSMRRYEQVSAARLWWQMNPTTTRWFRRSARGEGARFPAGTGARERRLWSGAGAPGRRARAAVPRPCRGGRGRRDR